MNLQTNQYKTEFDMEGLCLSVGMANTRYCSQGIAYVSADGNLRFKLKDGWRFRSTRTMCSLVIWV